MDSLTRKDRAAEAESLLGHRIFGEAARCNAADAGSSRLRRCRSRRPASLPGLHTKLKVLDEIVGELRSIVADAQASASRRVDHVSEGPSATGPGMTEARRDAFKATLDAEAAVAFARAARSAETESRTDSDGRPVPAPRDGPPRARGRLREGDPAIVRDRRARQQARAAGQRRPRFRRRGSRPPTPARPQRGRRRRRRGGRLRGRRRGARRRARRRTRGGRRRRPKSRGQLDLESDRAK